MSKTTAIADVPFSAANYFQPRQLRSAVGPASPFSRHRKPRVGRIGPGASVLDQPRGDIVNRFRKLIAEEREQVGSHMSYGDQWRASGFDMESLPVFKPEGEFAEFVTAALELVKPKMWNPAFYGQAPDGVTRLTDRDVGSIAKGSREITVRNRQLKRCGYLLLKGGRELDDTAIPNLPALHPGSALLMTDQWLGAYRGPLSLMPKILAQYLANFDGRAYDKRNTGSRRGLHHAFDSSVRYHPSLPDPMARTLDHWLHS
ncbi:MAG: hypothetical protein IPK24_07580 [Kineosporiaceae bacterium]|nr:hypothetical protein [Kineosporiaceae bacterium]MBK8075417.1 hypothetical protein [Kineosporiaceae bacterium]